ncbi:TetR/AcrR family transcriptional regulator [Catenulispora yoronensis]
MEDLPLLDSPPRERADAARNRALVLQAAWRLYTSGGVEALTTDAVAQEAGVGKGTVYRRFRDKSGLVAALLDDREKELQLAMISGPAPSAPTAHAPNAAWPSSAPTSTTSRPTWTSSSPPRPRPPAPATAWASTSSGKPT